MCLPGKEMKKNLDLQAHHHQASYTNRLCRGWSRLSFVSAQTFMLSIE